MHSSPFNFASVARRPSPPKRDRAARARQERSTSGIEADQPRRRRDLHRRPGLRRARVGRATTSATSNASTRHAQPLAMARRCSSRSTPSCATTSWKMPARKMAWAVRSRPAPDALIVQDMGLLMLDPAATSSCTPARRPTSARPEKAKFLQDVGFSQMVLARELDLRQIREIRRRHVPTATASWNSSSTGARCASPTAASRC